MAGFASARPIVSISPPLERAAPPSASIGAFALRKPGRGCAVRAAMFRRKPRQRTRAHSGERLAKQNEVDDFYRPRRPARHRHDARDARVRKDRCVKRGRLLGLVRIPQERGDLLHGVSGPLEIGHRQGGDAAQLLVGGHLRAQALLLLPQLGRELAAEVFGFEYLSYLDLGLAGERIGAALDPGNRLVLRFHFP